MCWDCVGEGMDDEASTLPMGAAAWYAEGGPDMLMRDVEDTPSSLFLKLMGYEIKTNELGGWTIVEREDHGVEQPVT